MGWTMDSNILKTMAESPPKTTILTKHVTEAATAPRRHTTLSLSPTTTTSRKTTQTNSCKLSLKAQSPLLLKLTRVFSNFITVVFSTRHHAEPTLIMESWLLVTELILEMTTGL